MSRVGKNPIQLPDGVDIDIVGNVVTVKGPKGTLSQKVSDKIKFVLDSESKQINCVPVTYEKALKASWGLYRMLVNNMIVGVSFGFSKTLLVEGVGYRAEMKGVYLQILAGYSHPIIYRPKEGVTLAVEGQNKIVISGIDKQAVGQAAAEIRRVRPPEPYKGKGIRYENENIVRKAGKAGAK